MCIYCDYCVYHYKSTELVSLYTLDIGLKINIIIIIIALCGIRFTRVIFCDHVPIICCIISLLADYVLLPEKNVCEKLRATPQAQQFFAGCHPVRIIRSYFHFVQPFIEFITIAKTVPLSTVFAYRGVLHAPINWVK